MAMFHSAVMTAEAKSVTLVNKKEPLKVNIVNNLLLKVTSCFCIIVYASNIKIAYVNKSLFK